MADYGVWQMVGVLAMVGTIPLMANPMIQNLFKYAYFKVRYLLQPGGAACVSLRWSDVPQGRVHQCIQLDPDPWHDPHARYHVCGNVSSANTDCWKQSVLTAFNKTPTKSTVKRPDALVPEIHSVFLRTDLRTLFAFLLCTVGPRMGRSYVPSAHDFEDAGIKFTTKGELHIARVRGSLRQDSYKLKKRELEKILDGYPPYYREAFKVSRGPVLPFPIRDEADITRAGWIIAVGLMTRRMEPLALYTVQNDSNEFRRQGRPFRMAVARAKEVIELISKQFPDQSAIPLVLEGIQVMIDKGSGSALSPLRSGLRKVGIRVGSPETKLDAQSCQFVMDLFNRLEPLTPEAVETFRPLLLTALQAALNGSFEVISYLKDAGHRLDLSLVEKYGWDHPVYVEGCR